MCRAGPSQMDGRSPSVIAPLPSGKEVCWWQHGTGEKRVLREGGWKEVGGLSSDTKGGWWD